MLGRPNDYSQRGRSSGKNFFHRKYAGGPPEVRSVGRRNVMPRRAVGYGQSLSSNPPSLLTQGVRKPTSQVRTLPRRVVAYGQEAQNRDELASPYGEQQGQNPYSSAPRTAPHRPAFLVDHTGQNYEENFDNGKYTYAQPKESSLPWEQNNRSGGYKTTNLRGDGRGPTSSASSSVAQSSLFPPPPRGTVGVQSKHSNSSSGYMSSKWKPPQGNINPERRNRHNSLDSSRHVFSASTSKPPPRAPPPPARKRHVINLVDDDPPALKHVSNYVQTTRVDRSKELALLKREQQLKRQEELLNKRRMELEKAEKLRKAEEMRLVSERVRVKKQEELQRKEYLRKQEELRRKEELAHQNELRHQEQLRRKSEKLRQKQKSQRLAIVQRLRQEEEMKKKAEQQAKFLRQEQLRIQEDRRLQDQQLRMENQMRQQEEELRRQREEQRRRDEEILIREEEERLRFEEEQRMRFEEEQQRIRFEEEQQRIRMEEERVMGTGYVPGGMQRHDRRFLPGPEPFRPPQRELMSNPHMRPPPPLGPRIESVPKRRHDFEHPPPKRRRMRIDDRRFEHPPQHPPPAREPLFDDRRRDRHRVGGGRRGGRRGGPRHPGPRHSGRDEYSTTNFRGDFPREPPRRIGRVERIRPAGESRGGGQHLRDGRHRERNRTHYSKNNRGRGVTARADDFQFSKRVLQKCKIISVKTKRFGKDYGARSQHIRTRELRNKRNKNKPKPKLSKRVSDKELEQLRGKKLPKKKQPLFKPGEVIDLISDNEEENKKNTTKKANEDGNAIPAEKDIIEISNDSDDDGGDKDNNNNNNGKDDNGLTIEDVGSSVETETIVVEITSPNNAKMALNEEKKDGDETGDVVMKEIEKENKKNEEIKNDDNQKAMEIVDDVGNDESMNPSSTTALPPTEQIDLTLGSSSSSNDNIIELEDDTIFDVIEEVEEEEEVEKQEGDNNDTVDVVISTKTSSENENTIYLEEEFIFDEADNLFIIEEQHEIEKNTNEDNTITQKSTRIEKKGETEEKQSTTKNDLDTSMVDFEADFDEEAEVLLTEEAAANEPIEEVQSDEDVVIESDSEKEKNTVMLSGCPLDEDEAKAWFGRQIKWQGRKPVFRIIECLKEERRMILSCQGIKAAKSLINSVNNCPEENLPKNTEGEVLQSINALFAPEGIDHPFRVRKTQRKSQWKKGKAKQKASIPKKNKAGATNCTKKKKRKTSNRGRGRARRGRRGRRRRGRGRN